MKTRRKFNDDYYCQTVEDFEERTFSDRFWDAAISWGQNLIVPGALIAIGVDASSWRSWALVLGILWIAWLILVFLHELNENIRYVRHQLRAHRDGFLGVSNYLAQFRDAKNFSVADLIQSLDREWERPSKQ